MQVALPFPMAPDLDSLQDLALQRRAETLHQPEAILLGCFLKFVNRRDAELLIDLEHLIGPKPWDVKHLKRARRNLFPHGV
jgi:hypothetical protein